MARTPKSRSTSIETDAPQTLAEMLLYLADPAARRELEAFRIAYESVHGATDLTRRYTSTWPEHEQDWLIEHDTKAYFDGLPPFVKAYVKGKMQIAAAEGGLDDMPDRMLRLFVTGQMRLEDELA